MSSFESSTSSDDDSDYPHVEVGNLVKHLEDADDEKEGEQSEAALMIRKIGNITDTASYVRLNCSETQTTSASPATVRLSKSPMITQQMPLSTMSIQQLMNSPGTSRSDPLAEAKLGVGFLSHRIATESIKMPPEESKPFASWAKLPAEMRTTIASVKYPPPPPPSATPPHSPPPTTHYLSSSSSESSDAEEELSRYTKLSHEIVPVSRVDRVYNYLEECLGVNYDSDDLEDADYDWSDPRHELYQIKFTKFTDSNCWSNHRKKSRQLPCFVCPATQPRFCDLGAYEYYQKHIVSHASQFFHCNHCNDFFPGLTAFCQHLLAEQLSFISDRIYDALELSSRWTTLYCVFARQGILYRGDFFPPAAWCKVCRTVAPSIKKVIQNKENFIDSITPEIFNHLVYHMIYFRYMCVVCLEKRMSEFKVKVPTFELYRDCSVVFPHHSFSVKQHLEKFHPDYAMWQADTLVLQRFMKVGFIEKALIQTFEGTRFAVMNELKCYYKEKIDEILESPKCQLNGDGRCQGSKAAQVPADLIESGEFLTKDCLKASMNSSLSFKAFSGLNNSFTDCSSSRKLLRTFPKSTFDYSKPSASRCIPSAAKESAQHLTDWPKQCRKSIKLMDALKSRLSANTAVPIETLAEIDEPVLYNAKAPLEKIEKDDDCDCDAVHCRRCSVVKIGAACTPSQSTSGSNDSMESDDISDRSQLKLTKHIDAISQRLQTE